MEKKYNQIAGNKLVGVIMLIFAVFGFLIIAHRLSFYVFEYDPQYSPVDYGKFNILSYFTVQSNFFAYVYLLFAGLSVLGVKKCEKIGFSPVLGALVTTYVIIAGITYCGGFPLGMTPPLKWDTTIHSMSSFIQVYYHMIMPVFLLVLWMFPFTGEKISKKCLTLSGIYPFVYSVFSVVRGAFSDPTYYPYPFYNPEFLWNLVSDGDKINYAVAYLVMAGLLVAGISLFVGITALVRLMHNKRVK